MRELVQFRDLQYLNNSTQFLLFKSIIEGEFYGSEPKLRSCSAFPDMNVGWFIALVAEEEKTKTAESKYRWHVLSSALNQQHQSGYENIRQRDGNKSAPA